MTEYIVGETTIQTAQCPPECATAIAVHDRHVQTCPWWVAPLGTAWCKRCHRRVQITEESDEGGYDHDREYAMKVVHLACGHSTEGRRTFIGTAPGGEALAEAVADRKRSQAQAITEMQNGEYR